MQALGVGCGDGGWGISMKKSREEARQVTWESKAVSCKEGTRIVCGEVGPPLGLHWMWRTERFLWRWLVWDDYKGALMAGAGEKSPGVFCLFHEAPEDILV